MNFSIYPTHTLFHIFCWNSIWESNLHSIIPIQFFRTFYKKNEMRKIVSFDISVIQVLCVKYPCFRLCHIEKYSWEHSRLEQVTKCMHSINIVACRTVAMQRLRYGRCTRAISGQRLGKHVPASADTNITIGELCFLRGPCRDVISKGQGQLIVSSIQESVKRGLEPEAEE
jgi:hypothetical protein